MTDCVIVRVRGIALAFYGYKPTAWQNTARVSIGNGETIEWCSDDFDGFEGGEFTLTPPRDIGPEYPGSFLKRRFRK